MSTFLLLLTLILDSQKWKLFAGRGTLQKLDRIFATHGIPTFSKVIMVLHFFGEEFRAHMEENGIKHQKVTPLWPQANGEAESFMKPLTKAVRSAHAEGRDWKKELYRFLLNYRATPHQSEDFNETS